MKGELPDIAFVINASRALLLLHRAMPVHAERQFEHSCWKSLVMSVSERCQVHTSNKSGAITLKFQIKFCI